MATILYDDTEYTVEIESLIAELRKRDTDPRYKASPVWDVYARISRGYSAKDTIKCGRQLVEILKSMLNRDCRLGEVFTDPKKSAWKLHGKRPGFVQVIHRIEKGITQGVFAWHLDRLARQPRDMERLISAAIERQQIGRPFTIASCYGDHLLNGSLLELRIKMAFAAEESEAKSRRLKDKNADDRQRGRIAGGSVPFGHQPHGDIEIPELQLTRERQAVKDGIEALLAGMSLTHVARMWNDRGLTRRNGLKWDPQKIRATVDHARHAGMVEHHGKIVRPFADAYATRIVTVEQFMALRALFDSRKRGKQPVTESPYYLSGMIFCDHCGTKLVGSSTGKVRMYRCPPRGCGKVSVLADAAEKFAAAHAIQTLADPEHAFSVARASQALDAIESQITTSETALRGILAKVTSRPDRYDIFAPSIGTLELQLDILTAERDAMMKAGAGQPHVMADVNTLHLAWEKASPVERATMFRRAHPRGFFVCPVGRGMRLRGEAIQRRFGWAQGEASLRLLGQLELAA